MADQHAPDKPKSSQLLKLSIVALLLHSTAPDKGVQAQVAWAHKKIVPTSTQPRYNKAVSGKPKKVKTNQISIKTENGAAVRVTTFPKPCRCHATAGGEYKQGERWWAK